MRLVLATRNDHKVREVRRLLGGVAIDPLPDDVTLPPEDGDTFAANALGKARAAAAALGRPAIAGRPSAAAAARALPSAFAANVSPSSGGSATPAGSGSSAIPSSMRPSSRSL